MIAFINSHQALVEVLHERARQDAKWGEQNHNSYTWLAILMEEIGELSQAALHDEFGGKAAGTVRAELIHVAAVSISWLEQITRDKENDENENK